MPHSRVRATRLVFSIGLALFISGVVAIAGLSLWNLHRETIANGYSIAAMHSRAFEDHLTQSLHGVDVVAGGIATSQEPGVKPAILGQRLFDALRHAPYLRSISLLDEKSHIVASSNPANLGRRVASADFFPQVETNTDLLRIGRPWNGRDFADGHPADGTEQGGDSGFIPVLRPILVGDHRVTLLVAVNSDYFINHIGQKFEASAGRIRILRYDGVLLLSTAINDVPGKVPAESIHRLLDEKDFGSLLQTLAGDGEVLTAWRASRLFPFVVITHLDKSETLRRWDEGLRSALAVIIPILLIVSAITVAFYRRQLRLITQEVEIDRQRRMTSTVFDASNDIIIITDPTANILSVNPAFSRVTGYAAAESIGRNPRLLASGRQDADFYADMWQSLTHAGIWQGEIVNRRKDGELLVNWVTITAVRDAQGQLQHYIGVLADITERKQKETELKAAKEAAEVAALAKSRFLATMSHEIRTPMNGIIGMTDLALMSNPGPELRGYLDLVKASATSLMGVLSDVLDYSRMEAGHVALETIPFSVADIAESVVALFQPQATEKHIALKLVIAPDLPDLVTGDPLRLRQILTNLISNAIKFTQVGEVMLRVGTEATNKGTDYCFDIIDTGIGIPANKLDEVFDPFVQADGTVTRTHGGSGLGLSICRQLAQLMGGRIVLSSEVGRGTRFTVRLPFGAMAAMVAEADKS